MGDDAIHAGRQLFDKEFRYLRTLRVRAAVYWSFRYPAYTRHSYLPAPGRRQTLYLVFPLRKVL